MRVCKFYIYLEELCCTYISLAYRKYFNYCFMLKEFLDLNF